MQRHLLPNRAESLQAAITLPVNRHLIHLTAVHDQLSHLQASQINKLLNSEGESSASYTVHTIEL